MRTVFRVAMLSVVFAIASMLAPVAASADTPSHGASCTERLMDTTGALDQRQRLNLEKVISNARARTELDVYVHILPSAPYAYSPVAEANMFNTASERWWRTALDNCPNWSQEHDGRRSESPDLFVMFISADDDYVSIGHGSLLSDRKINEIIYTTVKPELKANGVAAAIEAGIKQLPRHAGLRKSPSSGDDSSNPWRLWVITGVAGAAIIAYGRLWVWANATDEEDGYEAGATADTSSVTETISAAWAREALAQLDDEWLKYEMDTEAYYLTKPLLRDLEDTIVRRYHDAMYALRDAVESLGGDPASTQVSRANALADSALSAWDAANRHAHTTGMSTLSPVERAALRRIHGMVSQLTDNATPRPMVNTIIARMRDEISKLERTPVPWSSVENLPAIHARVELLALVQGAR